MASTAVLPYSDDRFDVLTRTLASREEEIARLNQKLSDFAMSASTAVILTQNDKVSIRTVNRGDVVLFCLNATSDHYVVFHMGPTIHFLHSDCLPAMGLSIPSGDSVVTDSSQATSTSTTDTTTTTTTSFALAMGSGQRQPWAIGEITDKEYCQAN